MCSGSSSPRRSLSSIRCSRGMSGLPTNVSAMSPGIACSRSQTMERNTTNSSAICTRRRARNLIMALYPLSTGGCEGGCRGRPHTIPIYRSAGCHEPLHALAELESGQRLGEGELDPVVVELQDARVEERNVRLVAGDESLHLPQRLVRLLHRRGGGEGIGRGVELLVAVLRVVVAGVRPEERLVERREGR